jgi:cytochrome P450
MEPGATPPVDIFPIFHWLPESLYKNWITTSKTVGLNMNSLYSSLLNRVRQRRQNPDYNRGSMMDMVLDQNEKLGLTDHQIYFICGVMVEGASDTTATAIQSFIHAMTKWPVVLRKAQAEVDSVVGEERTPTWEDYASLPYVAATVKEAMRWRPVVPLAFPHAATEGQFCVPCDDDKSASFS